MSTAFYPLGMKTYNNHLHQGGYKSWKGTGVLSNPIGITAGTIRPLTNNDPTNNYKTGFGLPRPIKHARKGRGFNYTVLVANEQNPTEYIEVTMNRANKSSSTGTLVKQMIDTPGGFSVSQNTINEISNTENLDKQCEKCTGIGIIASYYPNTTFLTENPENNTQNPVLCCNAEKKARRRVVYASTNLKKNYYTTLQQYRQNRCKTYEQRAFNFQTNYPIQLIETGNQFVTEAAIKTAKPGSPLAILNTYFANCQPNGEIYDATENALVSKLLSILLNQSIITQQQYDDFNLLGNTNFNDLFNYLNGLPEENKVPALNAFVAFIDNPYYGVPFSGPSNPVGCKLVVYKPNNPQYAKQGAVSSSTRLLKLNVDTITTNAASFNKQTILKNKAPQCNSPPIIRFQNKKACYLTQSYNLAGRPTQPPFSSNHFAQSPVNPLM
jgi:hypothetical protein